MFSHIIEFVIDYFTNFNPKKAFGGILILIGFAGLQRIGSAGNANVGFIFAVGGLIIGGIGFVIVYYDIAKDKSGGRYDEMDTLDKAYQQQIRDKQKLSKWDMNVETKTTSVDKKHT